jgi:putative phage-type endonuclease
MSVVEFDRAQWLRDRKSAIGASEVAAVLGLSQWATPWEIWAEKTNKLVEWSGNNATRAGQLFERAVLDHAEQQLGELDRNVRIKCPGLPLAATCDAVVKSTNAPVEAKTTGIVGPIYGTWGDELSDQVPDEYLVQVHAQLICTKAEIGYLFALIPGRGVVEFHVEPNERLHATIMERLSDWWERHVVDGIEPSNERLPSIDVVKRLRREPAKAIEADAAFAELLRLREQAKEREKSAKDDAEKAEIQLLLMLGDAEAATLPDGRKLTYLTTKRKGYTVEPCEFRSIRVSKGKK